MKLIYEIINEAKAAKSVDEALDVIQRYDHATLREVLYYAYHPRAEYYITEWPEEYILPDTLPGISMTDLHSELRRIYLFIKGHPTSDALTEQRRKELLLQTLEGMEPAEAKVFMDIMGRNLGIEGLTHEKINERFPGLIT
jgi:hypothetical protein